MPGILHGSACFLLLFRGCNRIKGCQQQGGPLLHLCFNNYAISNMCVCVITTGQYSSLRTFYALKALVVPYLIMIYRQLVLEQSLPFMPKKQLQVHRKKKYVQKKCTICIFKQRPLSCIIMMETQKNRSPIKLSYYTSGCQ